MPKSYFCETASDRLQSWVLGKKQRTGMTDEALGKERGITQQAISRKIKQKTFRFEDFVFFVRTFGMDYDTFQYIVGVKED